MEKINLTKLKPGLGVLYAIRPGNGSELFYSSQSDVTYSYSCGDKLQNDRIRNRTGMETVEVNFSKTQLHYSGCGTFTEWTTVEH